MSRKISKVWINNKLILCNCA
ncbi:hypothetical protein Gotri_001266 [Gossypium trilobum]|uniref:Uncharacterized protein n=1 Tax=Gossypium trilobum TaxID=34281 RepID=A0A7J9FE48_9ROSI|nr:hypothetical protein [Gossypium trilobum]